MEDPWLFLSLFLKRLRKLLDLLLLLQQVLASTLHSFCENLLLEFYILFTFFHRLNDTFNQNVTFFQTQVHWLKKSIRNVISLAFDVIVQEGFQLRPFLLLILDIVLQLEKVEVFVRKQFCNSLLKESFCRLVFVVVF